MTFRTTRKTFFLLTSPPPPPFNHNHCHQSPAPPSSTKTTKKKTALFLLDFGFLLIFLSSLHQAVLSHLHHHHYHFTTRATRITDTPTQTHHPFSPQISSLSLSLFLISPSFFPSPSFSPKPRLQCMSHEIRIIFYTSPSLTATLL